MNLHIGTATGMGGGAQPTGPQNAMGGGVGSGYCIFTWMDVLSFLGAIFTLGGGGQAGPTQAGAAAGATIGWGAGIDPVNVSAHTIPVAATTTSMNPRIPIFLTIP